MAVMNGNELAILKVHYSWPDKIKIENFVIGDLLDTLEAAYRTIDLLTKALESIE